MTINFDMDGTIANLYGVENWLEMLMAHDSTPYAIAKPLINLSILARYLNKLISNGIEVNIISWLAKGSTPEYDEMVKQAKIEWIHKHLPSVEFTNIYIVAYGTPKSNFGTENDILFDDEKHNRDEWVGTPYTEKEILETLKKLLDK